ncbi:MAG: hypothetical protein K2M16_05555, partial [Muribaculaceae bacterium]|nr:hypothetical protein [Muribaculaceae bacterium]
PMPLSLVENVTFRNARLECTKDFYKDKKTEDYILRDFTFTNVEAISPDGLFDTSNISGVTVENVTVSKSGH